jgi:hypothetical protein
MAGGLYASVAAENEARGEMGGEWRTQGKEWEGFLSLGSRRID